METAPCSLDLDADESPATRTQPAPDRRSPAHRSRLKLASQAVTSASSAAAGRATLAAWTRAPHTALTVAAISSRLRATRPPVASGPPLPTGVLVARNLLLIAATVSAVCGARVHAAKVARPAAAGDVLVTA